MGLVAYRVTLGTDIVDTELPWDVLRPAEGEVELRAQRKKLTDSATDRVRTIEVLTQIARAQALQGKLVDADNTLTEAEKLFAAVEESDSKLEAKLRILLERGRVLTLRKTPSQARNVFLEVWTMASEAAQPFHAIDAARMLSLIESPKMRNAWTVRALELAESSKDPRVRRWRGGLYTALGWHFFELLQLPKALESFDKALACFRADGAKRQEIIARSSMAKVMRAMNRVPEALAIQEELLLELNRMSDKDGFVLEEIAECLHALKRTSEAEAYFSRAYDLLKADEWFSDNEPARIKRLKTLGKVKTPS
jgi:tetratricopeptide (TPR) repeat protein